MPRRWARASNFGCASRKKERKARPVAHQGLRKSLGHRCITRLCTDRIVSFSASVGCNFPPAGENVIVSPRALNSLAGFARRYPGRPRGGREGVPEDNPVTEETADDDIEASLNCEPEYEEEEDEPELAVEESNLNFSEFIYRFANVRIVKALSILLAQFDKNSDEINHYVIKMLHRIAWDCKMPGMIFQASIFRTLERILDSKQPAHKELQKFAVFIIRRFAEAAQKNRKLYMELLFWKTTSIATEVVEGYDAERSNKKVPRGVWSEAEEDELRTLFMEHQTNKYTQDLIDWLLENIINQERTRRGVMKKLKEMCLVVNSKAVKGEVQKRLPKEWSEEELGQLTELWEQLKDDDDPIDSIHNGLRIKRPKPKIKEKLLELGLAQDRKELRKKRARKSNHGKSSWETQSASNSDGDESTDEEARKSSGRSAPAPNKVAERKTKKSTRRRPTIVYTDAQLSGLLRDVIEKNMRESLEWIKESLQDAVDDRDEESSEGIPLVPLTDYSTAAMDSPSFQRLLRALGIEPPADEQESYWRIPANMLTSTIRKRCALIDDALAGNFIPEDFQEESKRKGSKADDGDDDSDDGVDVLEIIKKFFVPKETEATTSQQSECSATSETRLPKKSGKLRKSTKSTDKLEMVEESEANLQSVEPKRKSKGRAKASLESSDSEMELDLQQNKDETKRIRSGSSEEESTTTKKRRLLDSDEEEASNPQNLSKGGRKVISDEEEELLGDEENNAETKREITDEKKIPRQKARVIISDDED
ncbi:hypothetical protein KM043_002244 [Ampulex compressa]|nr:hypothetical protein KM043_002244 [Ampulex compressa]